MSDSFNRSEWENGFNKEQFTSWHCSICTKGVLNGDLSSLDYTQKESSKAYCEVDPGVEFIEYVSQFKLQCTYCRELYFLTFKGEVNESYYKGTNGYEVEYHEKFWPIFCYPAPLVFKIPENTPDLIRELLLLSFSTFYFDPHGAANKVRCCLEELCNVNDIPEMKTNNKGKEVRDFLTNRIEKLCKKLDIECGDYFDSLKTIGDKGSHYKSINVLEEEQQLDLEIILDVYEITSFLLDEIYSRPMRQSSAERINKKYN